MRSVSILLLLSLLLAVPAYAQPAPSGLSSAQPQTIRAQLRAKRQAVLSAGLGGEVTHLALREGDRVSEGTVLAGLDCNGHHAGRRVAEAKLGAAKAKLAAQERLGKLGQASGVEIEVAKAEAAMATAEAAVIDATLRKCEIRAPFAGVVVALPVRKNQYVREGEPLVELVDTEGLEIEMVLPSAWLAWLKSDSAFTLQVDELGKPFPAKVERIAGRVDPISQTVRVLGRLDGKPGGLLPGMSGTVRFEQR
ncbi:MAG: efflux RND transporter periplasmic adaptor subunit [Magnetospirillum sp.]|nr:efflux RND transporter periplasmic adaptor subunit [Magnetospirillum sp.]